MGVYVAFQYPDRKQPTYGTLKSLFKYSRIKTKADGRTVKRGRAAGTGRIINVTNFPSDLDLNEFYEEIFRVAGATETPADGLVLKLNGLENFVAENLPEARNKGYELCEATLVIDEGYGDLAALERVISNLSKPEGIQGGISQSPIIYSRITVVDRLIAKFSSHETALELVDIPRDTPIKKAELKFERKSTVSSEGPIRYIKSPSGHWRYEKPPTR